VNLPDHQLRAHSASPDGGYSGPDDIGRLHHDHITEDLVSDHDLWEHQDIGVAGARVAEPMDLKR
jgi:hypothetical protein